MEAAKYCFSLAYDRADDAAALVGFFIAGNDAGELAILEDVKAAAALVVASSCFL